MSDELLRATVGLPVAVLWSLGVPALAAYWWSRALASALVAMLVLATALPDAGAWLLVAATAALAARLRPPGVAASPGTPAARPTPLYLALAAALAIAAAAALTLAPSLAWEAIRDGGRSDGLVYVTLGLLAAVPLAGAIISWSLSPMAARLAADPELAPPGMLRAGMYIGWSERTLVFAFLMAGEPGAAGLALTAKSVARFPTFNSGSEPLAEYVLIGTLLSFLLVVLAAMGARTLLGLPVL